MTYRIGPEFFGNADPEAQRLSDAMRNMPSPYAVRRTLEEGARQLGITQLDGRHAEPTEQPTRLDFSNLPSQKP